MLRDSWSGTVGVDSAGMTRDLLSGGMYARDLSPMMRCLSPLMLYLAHGASEPERHMYDMQV